jgi:hypothetical protein
MSGKIKKIGIAMFINRHIGRWIMGLLAGITGVVQAQTRTVNSVGCISKLDSALMLDSNLDEWQKVLPIFLGQKEHLPILTLWPGPQAQSWPGPQFASMNLYAAWTNDGLALAAEVTDRELTKAMGDGKTGSQVTVLLAPGKISDFSSPNREKVQLTIVPPIKSPLGVSVAGALDSSSASAMVRRKGHLTKDGYCFELLIPWKLFSSFKPQVGQSLSLYQSFRTHGGLLLQRNASQDQPITLPQSMQVVVSEKNRNSVCWDLSLYSWIKTSCPCCSEAMTIRFETSPNMAALGTGVKICVSAKDGKPLLEKQFSFKEFTSVDGQWGSPQMSLDVAMIPNDGCDITVSVLNAKNKDEVVGFTRYCNAALSLVAKRLSNAAVKRIDRADLSNLSQKDPFRAAAWMGVFSSVEWTRRSLELNHRLPDNSVILKWAMEELQARLAVLEGKPINDHDAMANLLNLTANPESQILVEFERTRGLPDRKKGSVSIDWGSLPLMTAQVEEFSTEKLATDFIDKFKTLRTQKITIVGHDAYYKLLPYWQPAELNEYDPSKEFLLRLTPRKVGLTPLSTLEEINPDALAFFPSCPKKLKQALTTWAIKMGKNVISVAQDDPKKRIAFIGLPDESETTKKIRQHVAYRFAVSPQTGVLRFTKGRLAFTLPCLSLDSGKLFAEVILKGQAVSPQQVNQIRQALVRAIPYKAKSLKLPEGLDLYVGDVHTHTSYSDGSPSPLGLIAEAFYAHLDFCCVSDHHYHRNGVAPLAPLMENMNFKYPLIPSVELTYDWGHFNVYPLKDIPQSHADCSFTTVAQICDFAKKQGNAVVQWSHPDDWLYTTRDDLSFDPNEGIEAWEVHPPRYDEWKKAGSVPVLTGGSDTHYGVFSNPIRTIILAKNPSGDSLAQAIRTRNCALIDPYDGAHYEIYWECYQNPRMNRGSDQYVYGDDKMIQLTVDALAEGKYLKENKKKQIQKALSNLKLDEELFSERMKSPRP